MSRQGGIVILADLSGSMGQPAQMGRKIDRLREAVTSIWAETPGVTLLTFSGDVQEVEHPRQIGEPRGSTRLNLGLEAAAACLPAQVVVISDGRPDSEESALVAAELIPGTIDCIFIGRETDTGAIAFLEKLSRNGGGRSWVNDLTRVSSLINPLREALALPSPISLTP